MAEAEPPIDTAKVAPATPGDAPVEAPIRAGALYLNVFVVAICGLVYELLAGTLGSYLLGDSVTQFWSQQTQRSQPVDLGLIAQITEIAGNSPTHVGIGLSLAVLEATKSPADSAHAPNALRLLQSDDALTHILSADPPGASDSA